MKKKYFRDWDKFVASSGEFLNSNMSKSRVTFKYRNKHPSYGKLYATNDEKSYYFKLTEKNDLDKIENYFTGLLHMLANKPIEVKKEEDKKIKEEKEVKPKDKKNDNKKKGKKDKKH